MNQEIMMLLKAQITLCHQLLVLGNVQTERLVAGQADDTVQAVREQEEVFHKFCKLTTRKTELLQGKPQLAVGTDELQLQLTELMQELKRVNSQNRIMLEKAMQIMEFDINIMTQVPADDVYAPPEQSVSRVAAPNKMFDAKI